MKEMASKKAKDNFGELLDTAQREPIKITKKNRPVAVVISLEEYQRLQELEDLVWAKKAQSASKKGYLNNKDSEALLGDLLNAKD
ncbi:MAG: type II toxin-antitoxin system Phd/YefM family antitoxin [Bdellovibrio sp.]